MNRSQMIAQLFTFKLQCFAAHFAFVIAQLREGNLFAKLFLVPDKIGLMLVDQVVG